MSTVAFPLLILNVVTMSLFLGPIADVEALLIGVLCRYSLKLEILLCAVFLSYLGYRRSKLLSSSLLVSFLLSGIPL
jgi:hypothetical protein